MKSKLNGELNESATMKTETTDTGATEKRLAGRLFDRRRLMVLVGRSAGCLSAASLVQTIVSPALGQSVMCAGPHDIRLRDFYRQFSAGDFDAMRRGFDPSIMLTVPFDGFPFPGMYAGADAVLSYFQRVAEAGFKLTLQGVAGFQRYSLAVHVAVNPRSNPARDCGASMVVRFAPEGLVLEASLFGFRGMPVG